MSFYDDLIIYPSNIACIDSDNNQLTYSELIIKADELGNIIGARTLVFLLCTNSIGSLVGYTAFLRQGIVPLLIKADSNIDSIYELIDIYEPAYVYIPKELIALFPEYMCIWEEYGYSLLRTNKTIYIEMYSELALLLSTSGSTGSRKLVRISYTNIQSNAQAISEYLEINENERPVTILPMSYTYGLSVINSHLIKGATILLTNKSVAQKQFWEFIKEHKATSISGVPYTYELLKKFGFMKMDLPELKTMTQAGGKLAFNLHKEFAEYAYDNNKRFYVMYGQTEATARMSYLPYEKAKYKAGSIGIAIPNGKLWLMNTSGEQIKETNIEGELIYEGNNVTLGYAFNKSDLQKSDERHGILKTNDMAIMDKDGFFYITGRSERFVKIYGNRVNLDELEQIILNKFDSTDCACIGNDSKIVICINCTIALDDIKKMLVNRTKLGIHVFNIVVVDEIPRNESGKINYIELNKNFFS